MGIWRVRRGDAGNRWEQTGCMPPHWHRRTCPEHRLVWRVNTRRRMLALGMSCLMVLAAASCGKPVQPVADDLPPPPPMAAFDTTETVHQIWMVPGESPAGTERVWQEINAVLLEEWNATVTLQYVPWPVWSRQSATLLAADAAPDALFVAGWGNYQALAQDKLLAAMEMDTLSRYAPDIAAAVLDWSEEGLRDCEVDGTAYMVPAAGNLGIADLPVLIRGDLRARAGLGEIRTLDDLDVYLDTLARSPEWTTAPWNTNADGLAAYLQLAWFQPEEMGIPFPDFPFLAYQIGQTPATIVSVMEEPSFLEALVRLRARAVSGALADTAMYMRMSGSQLWLAGQSACLIDSLDNVSEVYAQTRRDHPEWQAEWVLINPEARRVRDPLNQQGMAFSASAGETERFLMVLNELFSNKALQDLCVAGVPGVHHRMDAGNVYVPGEKAAEYPYDQAATWGWNNRSLMMAPGAGTWMARDVTSQWTARPDRILSDPLASFVFDPTPVISEINALGNVLGNEARSLLGGTSVDVSADLDALREAFSKAGLETVRVEMQRQVDLFMKTR